jgi:hypothetical protein
MLLRIFLFMGFIMIFSETAAVGGINPNALIQGPFKNQLTGQGDIRFEWSEDGRNILFFADDILSGKEVSKLVDTYEYADGPVELLSAFFKTIDQQPTLLVLLRWTVDYQQGDKEYQYYYETKAYHKTTEGYQLVSKLTNDPKLSGYKFKQHNLNASASAFQLDDADKIKSYLDSSYPAE